jgi:hypothetical protein
VTGITYPSSATNSFVYNGEDLRVSKTDSAGTSAQITDGTAPASPVLKDARAVYTPGISERAGTTSKFYHGDALGSTRRASGGSEGETTCSCRPRVRRLSTGHLPSPPTMILPPRIYLRNRRDLRRRLPALCLDRGILTCKTQIPPAKTCKCK